MKVLIVMSGAADASERGIHARRLPALFAQLRERDVELHVTLLGDAAGLAVDLAPHVESIEVLPTRIAPSLTGAIKLPGVVLGLRRRIRDLAPDVVEGDESLPAIAAAIAARMCSQSTAVTIYRRHHLRGRPRLRAASALAAHLVDYVAVSSDTVRAAAGRLDKVPAARVVVARSGAAEPRDVDAAETAALRSELGIAPGAAVLCVVSRLRHEKGIDVLLAALDDVHGSEVHLVVVGEGPEEAALRDAARRLRTPVHFVGHRADVWPWFAVSDIVVVPSRREAYGRVPVEAMAAGRAVVASAVGGLVEAVQDGQTGLLVAPDDPAGLSVALSRLVSSPSVVRNMGVNARARYDARHTIGHMAESWHEAWLETAGLLRQETAPC